jgi:uncharacterized protein YjbJ (UPF0337 family)
MNWDTVKGDWKQFQGKVKEQWGKLTDEDLNQIQGRREQLAGAIQKRYGIEKDEAERQVHAFEDECQSCESERRTGEAQGREMHEKSGGAHNPMHNPNRQQSDSGQTRHDPRRHEEQTAQSNDPKSKQQSGDSGQRIKDKEMAGEKNMEGKHSGGAQKEHSQQPRGKK